MTDRVNQENLNRFIKEIVKAYCYQKVLWDGTVSEHYDKKKARFSFNALKDISGFNWTKGYDPNDTVEKKGWHGAYNKDGYRVKYSYASRRDLIWLNKNIGGNIQPDGKFSNHSKA